MDLDASQANFTTALLFGAARQQIFRSRKTGRTALWRRVAVLHQSPAELWVCVLRARRADDVNVKSTTLAFTG